MQIDNSMAQEFRRCPLKFFEKRRARYPGAAEVGIEPTTGRDSLDFGSRLHALRHGYYWNRLYPEFARELPDPPLENEQLEAEAQATWQAYLAHYPAENFEIVETEQTRVVDLPRVCCGRLCLVAKEPEGNFDYCPHCGDGRPHHELIVKLDALIRNNYGALQVNDLKTEGRSSGGNDPESWAAKPQVSLYIYAARQLYPNEQVSDEVFLDVIRRQSPKGQKGPEFFRDSPRRSEVQIAEDLRDLIWVADQIEACDRSGYFPAFKDACKQGNWKCDFFALHINAEGARDEILRAKYRPATPYLDLVNIA